MMVTNEVGMVRASQEERSKSNNDAADVDRMVGANQEERSRS